MDSNSPELSELPKSEEVLRPVLLSLELPKSPLQIKGGSYYKILSISVPCLQKLLSNNAIDSKSLPVIVKRLSLIIDNDIQLYTASKISKRSAELLPDDLCVKILQALTTLITGSTGASIYGETLAGAVSIAFKLHARGGASVRNTASATLPMVISMLFDRAQADLGKTPDTNATKDAYSIMCDICALTNKDPATFLRLERLHSTFGLELIELIVSSHEKLFVENKAFKALLPDKVCPTLIKYFKKINEFPYCVRVVRIVNVLIVKYLRVIPKEVEVLLIRVADLLDQEKSTDWQQIVLLEILKNILNIPDLVANIYYNYDASHIIKLNAIKRRREKAALAKQKHDQEAHCTHDQQQEQEQEQQQPSVPAKHEQFEEIKFDKDRHDDEHKEDHDESSEEEEQEQEEEEEGNEMEEGMEDNNNEEEEEEEGSENNESDQEDSDADNVSDSDAAEERIPEEQSKKFEIYTVFVELIGKLIQAKFIPGSFIMEDAIPNSRIRV